MLPFTVPDKSTYRLLYTGPVDVAGVNVQQSWDLTVLPKNVREDPTFADNFLVLVRQIDAALSAVSSDIAFQIVDSLPVAMILTLTCSDPAAQVSLEAWYIHSVIR